MRDLRGVVDLPRYGRDSKIDQPPGPGVDLQQLARICRAQQLGLEIGIRLLDELDGLFHPFDFHAPIMAMGCDNFSR